MNSTDGARTIADAVICAFRKNPSVPFLIGITGPVAAGKSRFASRLMGLLRGALGVSVVHIPFDYWINRAGLSGQHYVDRFFIEEFTKDIECLNAGLQWMCPRYDLLRRDIDPSVRRLEVEENATEWEGRRFFEVSTYEEIEDVPFGNGVYADSETGRLYSRCIPLRSAIYVIDGTLIAQNEKVRSCYAKKIYVESAWANRITRMIRRHSRKEVFGATNTSETEYVGFLVNEARGCADAEIELQKSNDTDVIVSSVDSISNLMDLYQLLERIAASPGIAEAYQLSQEEVGQAILKAKRDFATASMEHLVQLRSEFIALLESRHLIRLENTRTVFSELSCLLNVAAS